MEILETGVVSEGKDIIKHQQVSNGTTNPAKWVSCVAALSQHVSISRPTYKSYSAVYFIAFLNDGLRYIT